MIQQQDFKPRQSRDQGLAAMVLARFGARHQIMLVALLLLLIAMMIPGWRLARLLPTPLTTHQEQALVTQPRTTIDIPLPSGNATSVIPSLTWQSMKVRSGETLATIFRREQLELSEMHQMLRIDLVNDAIKKLRPGQLLQVARDSQGRLQGLRYEEDAINSLQVLRSATGFDAQRLQKPVSTRTQFALGTITSSLFAAAESAGISDALVMELANVFGYDIDFALDLRVGDQFALVYEEKLVDGVPIASGTILAAEFVNDGHAFKAVRYVDHQGYANYYAPDGKAMRKAFLRAPLQFSRISSNFSLSRKHPILNRIRAHKGVDYAAPAGTPVFAAGDGRVSFAGTRGGYGRLVAIQHGNQYVTHYAHLSRYASGVSTGTRVRQGQTIGYVGSSGLATAPHLHYEFLMNGVHRNPRTIALPTAEPVKPSETPRFLAATEAALLQLENQAGRLMAVGR